MGQGLERQNFSVITDGQVLSLVQFSLTNDACEKAIVRLLRRVVLVNTGTLLYGTDRRDITY